MSAPAKLALAARMAAAAGAVALEHRRGWRLPARADAVPPAAERLTCEWLTEVLCREHIGAAVVDFTIDTGSDGTSCRRPLRVTYNEVGVAAGLPRNLFTKTTASLRSRLTTGLGGLPSSECLFYNHIRQELRGWTGPAGYYAAFDPRTARSMVIMEDVVATQGARFGGAEQPASRAEAEQMVEQMAAYHAAFWESPRHHADLSVIPTAAEFQARMDRMIDFAGRSQVGLDRSLDVLPPEIERRRDELWPALMQTFALQRDRPRTIVHQDVHPGNWYRTANGGIALCDWHGLSRGLWAIDVAYALSAGLRIDDRRSWERNLIAHYLAALDARGVLAPSFDEAWLDYRREQLHGLVYWLFTIGKGRLAPEMHSDATCRETIRRTAQAVIDLGTLDQLRPAPGTTNPTHSSSAPDLHWTTTNVGEAAPGVQSPLSWSLWQVGDAALRKMGYALGVLSRRERVSRTPEDRVFRVFYGRAALQVEFLAMLGDRMPGTTGEEVASDILGRSAEDMAYHPTRRRYPTIAWRLPWTFVSAPAELKRFGVDTERWYHDRLPAVATADADQLRRILADAAARLEAALTIQGIVAFGVVQPMHQVVEKLVARTGRGDVGVLSGSGGAETSGMLADIWTASRGRLSLEDVLSRHGFHGPAEGELSSTVWREDDAPLRRRMQEYRQLPEDADPAQREEARRLERLRMVPEVVAALPAWQRPVAHLLLGVAAARIPLRGVAKRSMLQAFDVARAAARRLGTDLAAAGVVSDPNDVFFLTVEELVHGDLRDARSLVDARRADRARYLAHVIRGEWTGPARLELPNTETDSHLVEGIGVSSGVVEGLAHVVLGGDADIEEGEILVAPTTDPGWAALMMLSSALVVDIGGALSHAAVVARELGLPCIVNTRNGTRAIRTGDRIRVDGSAGTVEILERCESPPGPLHETPAAATP